MIKTIKTIIKFILGFIGGCIAAYLLTYAFGMIMNMVGVQLFDSESDQQRNFNIFLIFTLLVAVVTGYLATRIKEKGVRPL